MPAKFDQIVAIAKMKYLCDQSKFNKIAQRRADLLGMNDRLDESRYLTSPEFHDSITQKHNFHWGRWIDATQATVNMELFTLAGEEEISRAQLKKSYGSYLAIDSISKNS
jgi:hypothetical protein